MIYDAWAVELWAARQALDSFRADLPAIDCPGERKRICKLIEEYQEFINVRLQAIRNRDSHTP